MSEDINSMEYNEDDAIAYILSKLPAEVAGQYTDNDILLIIDTIFDFYDSKGFFDISITEDEDSFEEGELIEFVKKAIKKDKANKVKPDDVANIVLLELEYEDSINGGL